MATIEREHELARVPNEFPVFVASDGRRARRLRLAATGIGVLALLWLVALAAGMLGFGSLPGISTPMGRIGGPDEAPSQRSEIKAPTPVQSSQRRSELIGASERSGGAATPTQPAGVRVASTGSRAKPVARRPQAPPPATVQPVQPQPALPPPPQQGWARHGRPAPSGYTRHIQPQPAPPPGQAIAPGQTRKALQPAPLPPPPPPPPPGNGGGPKKS